MAVILEVARHARCLESVRERIVAVTSAAAQIDMRPIERELRIPGMIETGVVPAVRAVAVLALLATATIVSVIRGVATVAGRRCVHERAVFVTAEARSIVMKPDQRPSGSLWPLAAFAR